jgi:hypothetical protein
MVRHASELSPERLAQLPGRPPISAVVCDLDNTLAEWHSEHIASEVIHWLSALHDAGIGVCLASNTRNLPRLARVAEHLGVHHVPGNAGKPGTAGMQKALALLGARPEAAAMVGDQLFTDIVAGNRLGLFTVLVNPLGPREFIGTRLVSRSLERLVLRGERRRPG